MTRKHTNSLDMQKRFQILDWLRAHPDDLPNMTGDEIVAAVSESINHPCTLAQVRDIAKAANMRWAVKRKQPSGKTGSGGRMDRLEARIANIEAQLGITLPSDDELPGFLKRQAE